MNVSIPDVHIQKLMSDASLEPGTFVVFVGVMKPKVELPAAPPPQEPAPEPEEPKSAEPVQEELPLASPPERKQKPRVYVTRDLSRKVRDNYRFVGGSFREVGERFGISESTAWRIARDLYERKG